MTHCAERGGNEAAAVKACYTHRSKHSLGRLTCTKNPMKEQWRKSGKEGRKGQSGSDASFIEWDCICRPFPPSINICGWLVLASELSAVREGLVLIRRDSNGKGQRGGEAGEAAYSVLGPVPSVEQHRQGGLRVGSGREIRKGRECLGNWEWYRPDPED